MPLMLEVVGVGVYVLWCFDSSGAFQQHHLNVYIFELWFRANLALSLRKREYLFIVVCPTRSKYMQLSQAVMSQCSVAVPLGQSFVIVNTTNTFTQGSSSQLLKL